MSGLAAARRSRSSGERGAVTAELALALPVLLAVTTALVWLLSVGAAQVRTVDAAREAARAVARGDDAGEAVAAGERVAPDGVSVVVATEGGRVVARASGQVPGPGGLFSFLPGATVAAEAVAVAEEPAGGPP
jgi:Flp pilus assembly protein TadG